MQDTFQERDIECDVVRLQQLNPEPVAALCQDFGLRLTQVAVGEAIPGSYWQAPEAGLLGDRLFVRADTPAHSLLHEGCHFICMDGERRSRLDTDAGGEFVEENAVCYLQILLADRIPGLGRQRMLQDMDRWGYSFRLGSARAWFEQDADDARQWLLQRAIIDAQDRPTGQLCP